jgi:DNA-binding winged helix-turn-helix (wHTH) protein
LRRDLGSRGPEGGKPIDRFVFDPSYNDDEIAEQISSGELLNWSLVPPAAWRAEVLWDDVVKTFNLNAVGAASSKGRLRINNNTRQVQLEGVELKLSPRSFRLLSILAAAKGDLLHTPDLAMQLLPTHHSKTAIASSIDKLKRELVESGIERTSAQRLVENTRGIGYRLTLHATDISIEE